jgi:hypothetical protein
MEVLLRHKSCRITIEVAHYRTFVARRAKWNHNFIGIGKVAAIRHFIGAL